ncbi:protein phosphatase 2C domain-containing protein [Nonomuraea sp. NBC_01738]|uniref:PP2C family serine/threonine-protein phosphatase n=1 Tax=Nonomuraea sp. NBC_01738 TaxID=2976003 RepID=UPI002E11D50C|nr:protein phosphatase 2C domain-containing protein [Nonomuraea sp. NBC_01738]
MTCPLCDYAVLPGDAFCEECGHPLSSPSCTACGAAAVDQDGYCERCGLRQPTGRDHEELALPSGAAGVTDKGLRRSRNEDAMALIAPDDGPRTIAVVCDGVASSPRADEASALAVSTSVRALAAGASTKEAFGLAAMAVAGLTQDPGNAPACTYVSAEVSDGRVTLAWAGDSRAYWLPGWVQLTVDDAAPTGEITSWLGADAGPVEPQVRTFAPSEPGLLCVCSDGLSGYLDESVPDAGEPRELARHLLKHALDSGGRDNITIVLIPVTPSGGSDG